MLKIPEDYDYIGIYLTELCHLKCPYCITRHHGATYGVHKLKMLTPEQWVDGINRLEPPPGIPVTLQGGEPFLYPGIRKILENIRLKADILTALPPHIDRAFFESFSTLEWNRREAPYPRIRVSFHKGQNDFRQLVQRVSKFNDLVSIGIYYLKVPGEHTESEIEEMKKYAADAGVELRHKEFLGMHNGNQYGEFRYPEAVSGKRCRNTVLCRNTVVPIAPDGTIYRCHSDLYFQRHENALGNITNTAVFPEKVFPCSNFGLCSECDVKIKNNHLQQFGYTSASIEFQGDLK